MDICEPEDDLGYFVGDPSNPWDAVIEAVKRRKDPTFKRCWEILPEADEIALAATYADSEPNLAHYYRVRAGYANI